MPIYDFQCTSCGHKLELLRKISDSSTTTCPSCSQETFSKMLSAPSFQLSGSGWYATDFKNNNAQNKPQKMGSETPEKSGDSSATANSDASCKPGCACH